MNTAHLKVYKDFKHNGYRCIVRESSIARGNQFKALVNSMSLGCHETEEKARQEAIRFADLLNQ